MFREIAAIPDEGRLEKTWIVGERGTGFRCLIRGRDST